MEEFLNEDLLARETPLNVELDGYEGPLDLLLALARTHKLDLTNLSMLALAEQYIGYIQDLKDMRLELAADYLVMAAWLMFLKSKLLIPKDEDDEGLSGEEMAARLSFRLMRLEAMRDAVDQLHTRKQLGQDFYLRGMVETIKLQRHTNYYANSWDLVRAYSGLRQKQVEKKSYTLVKRQVWSIKRARQRLEKLLGMPLDWAPIQDYLAQFIGDDEERKTMVASTFSASLELVREGQLQLKQETHFGALYIKGTNE